MLKAKPLRKLFGLFAAPEHKRELFNNPAEARKRLLEHLYHIPQIQLGH